MHLIIHVRDKGVVKVFNLDNNTQVVIHIPKWIRWRANNDKYKRLHITFE